MKRTTRAVFKSASLAKASFSLLCVWGCSPFFFDLVPRIDAAIHAYEDSYFFSVNDAFIYRGGREGLFKSSEDDDTYDFSDWGVKRPAGLANGKSYIRFNKVAFRRS